MKYINHFDASKALNSNELMSNSIGEIAKALSNAQSMISNVKKSKKGVYCKYADLTDCLNAIRKPFEKQELAIVQLPTIKNDKKILTTVLMHSSGQWIKSEFLMEFENIVKNNGVQNFGALMTYARRYALAAIAGIGVEDDDADSLTYKNNEYNKSKNQPEAKTIVNKPLTDREKLHYLCQQNKIDSAMFAAKLNIAKHDNEKITDAVNNWDEYKTKFNIATHNNEYKNNNNIEV